MSGQPNTQPSTLVDWAKQQERWRLRDYIREQIVNFTNLPQLDATNEDMWLKFVGKVEILREIEEFLSEASSHQFVEANTAFPEFCRICGFHKNDHEVSK